MHIALAPMGDGVIELIGRREQSRDYVRFDLAFRGSGPIVTSSRVIHEGSRQVPR